MCPAMPLMGIYPSILKTLICKYICTAVFIAALFVVAKTWKQPRCPLTDDWMKRMWHIHTMRYCLAGKKDEIQPFATTRMDLENTMLSKISQTENFKNHMISLIHELANFYHVPQACISCSCSKEKTSFLVLFAERLCTKKGKQTQLFSSLL